MINVLQSQLGKRNKVPIINEKQVQEEQREALNMRVGVHASSSGTNTTQ